MQNRRKFIHDISNAGLGLFFLSRCRNNNSGEVLGEEWKKNGFSSVDKTGNYQLTPGMKEKTRAAIERHRMGLFRLRLVDQKNNPVKSCKVEIHQNSHHFDWGFSGAREICSNIPNHKEITGHIKRLFNCTTAKCYWDERWHQPIEHEEGVRVTDTFENEIKWALSNGLNVKGHPLVWTVRKAIPRWMDKYSYINQMKKLEEHVRDLIRIGGTDVKRWDLCNEMLWEPSLRNLPQRKWPHIESTEEILTYLEPAVQWAKDENPYALYSLNDYGLVKTNAPGITSSGQRKRYVDLVKEMKKRGCAPDAIGTQCHVAGWYSDNEFMNMLDHLAETGLPIQVTEFWAKLKDCPFIETESEKKMNSLVNYVEMIYTLAFAHPSVNHLTYWGSGNWFNDQGKPLPLYYKMFERIQQKWKTHDTIVTNNEGEIEVRAFYGGYNVITRDKQGNIHYYPVSFDKTNNKNIVTIKILTSHEQ